MSLDLRGQALRQELSERAPRKILVARLWRFRPFKYDRHRFSTFLTLHIATFQVRGFFAYKAFPLTVATVLCEPLRTLSRGLCTLPHAAAHRLLPLRELPSVSASQSLTLADKLIALSDPTL